MKIVAIGDARSVHVMRYLNYFASRGHEMHLISYDDPIEKYVTPHDWVGSTGKVGERIFIPSKNDEEGRQVIGTNPTIHVVGSDHLFLKFFWRDRKVRKIIRSIQPDIVHAHFVTKYGFHIRKGEIPTLITAWGDDILVLPEQSGMIKSRTAKVLKAADHIYAVSQNIKDKIISDYEIDGLNITVNPGGIDMEEFNPERFKNTERAPGDKEVILFCNRGFNPVYDIPTLVKAFRAARSVNPNLALYLAGSEQIGGGEKVNIIEGDGLYLLGQIKHEEMPNYLTAADIFISTATSDGTPVSMLEAMAMKKPCIMTAVGGIPEWIKDGWNGVLVPPGDVEAISAAILGLSAISGSSLGENARITVELRGNFYKNMGEIEQRYKGMVFKKGEPQPWRKQVKEPEVSTKEETPTPGEKKSLVDVVLESGVKPVLQGEEEPPVERVKANLVEDKRSEVVEVFDIDEEKAKAEHLVVKPDKGSYAKFITEKVDGMTSSQAENIQPLLNDIRRELQKPEPGKDATSTQDEISPTDITSVIQMTAISLSRAVICLSERAALADAEDAMKFMVAAHQGIEALIMLEGGAGAV